LTNTRKELNRLEREAYRWRHCEWHPAHKETRALGQKYAAAIQKAKTKHWNQWLEELDGQTVWNVGKMAKGTATDGGRTRVPNLISTKRGEEEETTARDNETKAQLLFEEFFPEPPKNHNSGKLQGAARWKHENISNDQIRRAIKRMKPYKATKPGTIPNCVLKETGKMITPYLGPLFRATFNLKYYPEQWAKTTTIALKKGDKPDYTTPNAWRPISLSDGFARLLNSCMAEELSYRCETLGILPNTHFGGRPGYNTGDAVHYLASMVKEVWRRKKVVTILFLDIKGAFPSVVISKLLDNLTQLGIPSEILDWLRRRYEKRKTEMTFDDYKSEEFDIDDGLDQGDALSPLLFMLYNSGLAHITINEAGEVIIIYIRKNHIWKSNVMIFNLRKKLYKDVTRVINTNEC
jgi:Zn-finger protein